MLPPSARKQTLMLAKSIWRRCAVVIVRWRGGLQPALHRMLLIAVGGRGTLPPMVIILILAVALVAGISIRNRWALLLPLGVGAVVALAIGTAGHGLGDTPIPFLVVLCILVMVGGQGLRSRRAPDQRIGAR